jgi:hypothetical protein
MPAAVFAYDPTPAYILSGGLSYTTIGCDPGTAALLGLNPYGDAITLDDNGTLFIPSSITIDDGDLPPVTLLVTTIASTDYAYADPLSALPAECTQISLPATITSIESEAFAYNNNLQMVEILSNDCNINQYAFTASDNVDLYIDMPDPAGITTPTFDTGLAAVSADRLVNIGTPGDIIEGFVFEYIVLTAGTLASPGTAAICQFNSLLSSTTSLAVPATVYDDGDWHYRYLYNVIEVAEDAFYGHDIGYVVCENDIKIADTAFNSGSKVYVTPDSDAMENYESTKGAVKYTYYGDEGDEFTIGDYTFVIDSINFSSGSASLTLKACNLAGVSTGDIAEDISDYDGLASSEYLKIDNISDDAFSHNNRPKPKNTTDTPAPPVTSAPSYVPSNDPPAIPEFSLITQEAKNIDVIAILNKAGSVDSNKTRLEVLRAARTKGVTQITLILPENCKGISAKAIQKCFKAAGDKKLYLSYGDVTIRLTDKSKQVLTGV